MNYIELVSGNEKTLMDVRRAHPKMAIPDGADLTGLGYAELEETVPPTPGGGEVVVKGAPEEYEPGKWRETWAVEPAPVPDSVSALQALLALEHAGLASLYEAWANDSARTFGEKAFINKAERWDYDNVILRQAATDMGISVSQLGDLFKLAATL